RDGFSDPRFRASSPTTHRRAASSGQGRRRLSAGKSNSPATYRKDGSSEPSETSPAFTSCGIARISIASSPVRSAHAIAELVVPRSIPTLYRASPAISCFMPARFRPARRSCDLSQRQEEAGRGTRASQGGGAYHGTAVAPPRSRRGGRPQDRPADLVRL